MDIGRILTRSLEISWKYKFLWLFAFIMALTAGRGFDSGFPSNSRFDTFSGSPFTGAPQVAPVVIGIAVLAGLILFIVWAVLTFYFRFVARGALVSSVNVIENGGTTNLREAWASGRTFYSRLLGLGLLVNVPFILFTIALILVAVVPIIGAIISASGQTSNSASGIFAAIGLTGLFAVCCAILCIVFLVLVIHPLYEFAVRAIVLDDMHVRDGIREGIRQVREHLGSVLLVYGILIGARVVWGIIVGVVTIPLALILFGVFGGAFRFDLNAVIIGVLVLAIPLWLVLGAVEGVFQLFESNMWTETYLALQKKVAPVQ